MEKTQVIIKVENAPIKSYELTLHSYYYPYGIFSFPDTENININKPVTIDLIWNEKEYRIFTGYVSKIFIKDSKRQVLIESSNIFLDKEIEAGGWSKIKVKELVKYIIEGCRIQNYNIDNCPDKELKQFSHKRMKARDILNLIVDTLKNHGYDFNFFFDFEDRFLFSTPEESILDRGPVAIIAGQNLISTKGMTYEAFLLPVVHNQKFLLNNKETICQRSKFIIKPDQFRVEVSINKVPKLLNQFKVNILSTLKMPCLVEVLKSYVKKEKGGYCMDCEVLTPGSMERTGEILKEVPINTPWVGRAGEGIFTPPAPGQFAVVSFINFNPAFPYVAGFWAGQYSPADGAENTFTVIDGAGGTLKISDGLFTIQNKSQSLKTILETIIDEISGLKTVGLPSPHAISPDNQATLALVKTQISQLFKE